MIIRVFRFLKRLFRRLVQYRQQTFRLKHVARYPEPHQVKIGLILVVGDSLNQKWACFRCPGNCGEIISLSLNRQRSPNWSVLVDKKGYPSIKPSVRQLNACQCHFWITQGSTMWCTDSKHNLRKKKSL